MRTLRVLSSNILAKQSDLIIYADGPKQNEDNTEVLRVRRLLTSVSGFQSVKLVQREFNYGLAENIIKGVSEVLEIYSTAIILEDDILTSPWFLTYMNEALELYRDHDNVASIHAYTYPVSALLPETFFLRGADCWGWATWQRAWHKFNPDGAELIKQLVKHPDYAMFNFNGSFPFTQMLKDQIDGRNNSWAVRWYASAFLNNMVTLYPGKSLVQNIGNDNSGSHSKNTMQYDVDINMGKIFVQQIPIQDSKLARKEFELFFKKKRRISTKSRLVIAKIICFMKETVIGQLLQKFYFRWFYKRFIGPFANMEDAVNNSTGYDSAVILEKVTKSMRLVKTGLALAERDSIILRSPEYSWPTLAALLWSAAYRKGKINVIDFGGSLGSLYYQNRKFLNDISELTWSIIEQKHFVQVGKKEFEDDKLRFFYNIDECIKKIGRPDVVMLSSVLQYIDDPYQLLNQLREFSNCTIIIDRTPVAEGVSEDRVFVQKVPSYIYNASYPMRVFGAKSLCKALGHDWVEVESFYSNDNQYLYAGGNPVKFKGYIFRNLSQFHD
jgi:putative methyltransferase (TIGR04325 family)